MKQNVQEALRSSVTFNFDNSANGAVAKKLCLLPGVYDTTKFEQDGTSKVAVLSYSNPANLTNAGYPVDQVADDYNSADSGQFVHVTGTTRTRYRDFLNTVQRLGIRVRKIIIQNKVSSADIFDQEIELSRTAVGAKGATRFIKLEDRDGVHRRRTARPHARHVRGHGRSGRRQVLDAVRVRRLIDGNSKFFS